MMSQEIPGHVSDLLPFLPYAIILLMWFGHGFGRWCRDIFKDFLIFILVRAAIRRAEQPSVPASTTTSAHAPTVVSHLTPITTVPPPPVPQALPAPQTQPPPVQTPTTSSGAPGLPPWTVWSLTQLGRHGPDAEAEYIRLGKTGGTVGEAWCADFANAAVESVGIPGTHSASSQSFRNNSNFVQLPGPALGAFAVFWRGSPNSGLGHVCQYDGERGDYIWGIGGNEQSMVQIEALPKQSATFGLIGYWWPKSFPLPTIGPVILPASMPTHVVAPIGVPSEPAASQPASQPVAAGEPTDHSFQAYRADYAARWAAMKILPQHQGAIDHDVAKVMANKTRYEGVASSSGVPWYVIGIIDVMEAGGGCNAHLHNGDPLTGRTIHEPPGRPPPPAEPPFTWEQSALDALSYQHFDRVKVWNAETVAWVFESMNGFGYRSKNVPSPYLWSFSDQYTSGKFIRDHVFDASAVSAQAGAMTILKGLTNQDPAIKL